MQHVVQYLWLIPAVPLVMAGIGALLKRERRRAAAGLGTAEIEACIGGYPNVYMH